MLQWIMDALCLELTFRLSAQQAWVKSSLASVLGKAVTIFHLETSMVFIPPMGNLEDIQDPGSGGSAGCQDEPCQDVKPGGPAIHP